MHVSFFFLAGASICLNVLLEANTCALAFQSTHQGKLLVHRDSPSRHNAAKGFGAPAKTGDKKPNKKKLLKQLEKTYGGTSPEEIARGTQRKIDARLTEEVPPTRLAIQLYQNLQQWNLRIGGMTLLQQANIPVEEMEQANRAQKELARILDEQGLTTRYLHNLLQQATWDASADAKAVRSITGEMPKNIQKRVQDGCDAIAAAMNGKDGEMLDVGCGFGVLVPFLRKAGLDDSQIQGIDLSPEMIRNAKLFYPECAFESVDLFSFEGKQEAGYDAIMFCSALHDIPDMMDGTFPKARELLKDGGKMVILHAQGASHVANQVRNNPAMVPRGLPSAKELEDLAGWTVVRSPAGAKSRQEEQEGYIAVLEKTV